MLFKASQPLTAAGLLRSSDFVPLSEKKKKTQMLPDRTMLYRFPPPLRRPCWKRLHELDSIKLSGVKSKPLSFITSSCCSSSVCFSSCPRDGRARRPRQCLRVVIFLATEQWFSLGRAFLIIDTLWYGGGLASALAF